MSSDSQVSLPPKCAMTSRSVHAGWSRTSCSRTLIRTVSWAPPRRVFSPHDNPFRTQVPHMSSACSNSHCRSGTKFARGGAAYPATSGPASFTLWFAFRTIKVVSGTFGLFLARLGLFDSNDVSEKPKCGEALPTAGNSRNGFTHFSAIPTRSS